MTAALALASVSTWAGAATALQAQPEAHHSAPEHSTSTSFDECIITSADLVSGSPDLSTGAEREFRFGTFGTIRAIERASTAFAWEGSFAGAGASTTGTVLHMRTSSGDAVVVHFSDGSTLQAFPLGDGTTRVIRSSGDFPGCAGALAPPAAPAGVGAGAGGDAADGAGTQGGIAGSCDDGTVIDVLVMWTPRAQSQSGSAAAARAIAESSVAISNHVYATSRINVRMRAVGYGLTEAYSRDATSNPIYDLTDPSDGHLDSVHATRDALGADLVALITGENLNYCGIAWIAGDNSPEYGFSVTVWNCALGNLTFTHEVGHNQGCCHARGDGGGCSDGGIFSYSVGHRFTGTSGNQWRTVMAYSPGSRLPRFSSPLVIHDGAATGVAGTNGADNSRTINETASVMANYRCSVAPDTGARTWIDSGLLAPPTGGGSTTITVTDSYAAAAGTEVELLLAARADHDASNETFSLTINGVSFGALVGGTGENCAIAARTRVISAADFNAALLAASPAQLVVTSSAAVDSCPLPGELRLAIRYVAATSSTTCDTPVLFYADQDGDGYTLATGAHFCPGTSNPGFRPMRSSALDCDDASSSAYPGAPEICATDGTDNDCDGNATEIDANAADRVTFYRDQDGDSYTIVTTALYCPGTANAGWRQQASVQADCNDTSASIYPGAPELCATAGTDNDCDGNAAEIDANASDRVIYYTDSDGDTFTLATGAMFCPGTPNAGYRTTLSAPLDCNDASASIYPGAPEICATAGTDNDCDGNATEIDANASDRVAYYSDADGDTFTLATGAMFCPGTTNAGYRATVSSPLDCNDASASIYPGAPEICATAGTDNDCDGDLNDTNTNAPDRVPFFTDADGDGYTLATGALFCTGTTNAGYRATVSSPLDCNDASAETYPGAPELCSTIGTDNDCDGDLNEASGAQTYWRDADGDGFGSVPTTLPACSPPEGFVGQPGDCDDTSDVVFPSAPELCASVGTDNDCDGDVTDTDTDAADRVPFFTDADGDGHSLATGALFCPGTANPGFRATVSTPLDCDDGTPSTYPGAPELCANVGTDNDCDGDVTDTDADASDRVPFFRDADGDGYTLATSALFCTGTSPAGFRVQPSTPLDCDDGTPSTYPGAPELCATAGTDNDCDGDALEIDATASDRVTFFRDADGDGYTLATGAAFCPGTTNSGYRAQASAPLDCNDAAAAIFPGAPELCANVGTDNDCDGNASDIDSSAPDLVMFFSDSDDDGFTLASGPLFCPGTTNPGHRSHASEHVDCDDSSSTVYPGAPEVCATIGTDNDCDGDSQDASDQLTFYLDSDGDGLGDDAATIRACSAPPGYVATGGDGCPFNPFAISPIEWYRDADGDFFGNPNAAVLSCGQPSGHIPEDTDCDDTRAWVNPAAQERCDDGQIDEDCDGLADDQDPSATGQSGWYLDEDADGYGTGSASMACDPPSGSHVARAGDNCPSIPNPLQLDCDSDGYGDACAVAGGAADCDANGIPDSCAIAAGATDCDNDGILDVCEIAGGGDADGDGTLDTCQYDDCNLNRTPDTWDILQGLSTDCNDNDVPDDCEDGTVHADTGNLGALTASSPLDAVIGNQVPARTPVTIRISLRADLDAQDEYVSMRLNGIEVGESLLAAGGSACPAEPDERQLVVSVVEWLQVLDAATAPGEVHVQLVASAAVDSSPCAAPLARVTISYGGTSYDCDEDSYSDICEFDPATDDCNANGVFDACEAGTQEDTDSDGIPDECERALGDYSLDGLIDGKDLAALLTAWGIPNPPFGDFIPNGVVDGADLAFLLGRWGPLP